MRSDIRFMNMNMNKHNSTTRRIVIYTVTIAAIFAWMTVFDAVWSRSDAACVNDDGSSCTSASQMAKGFRQGELHNSKNVTFSPRIQRKINHWYANHPNARMPIEETQWWEAPFKQSICMMWGGSKDTCVRNFQSTNTSEWMNSTQKVVIRCGGSAILGATGMKLDGKVGWWGAGAGASICLFNQLGDKTNWW